MAILTILDTEVVFQIFAFTIIFEIFRIIVGIELLFNLLFITI